MGITKTVMRTGTNKLVIPYAGKMFNSNIAKDNKALCFVINKGYIETSELTSMLDILDDLLMVKDIVLVGKLEKIRLRNKQIVYRQRVFFKSLKQMLGLCKVHGLRFDIPKDFHITINNVLNCVDELKYLERYALKYDEHIDEWLTNCCVVHLDSLLKSMNMYSDLTKRVNLILRGKEGYLDRAPFLISSYDISINKSAIFLELDTSDKRLYSKDIKDKLYIEYGYTSQNIKEDLKGGVFN